MTQKEKLQQDYLMFPMTEEEREQTLKALALLPPIAFHRIGVALGLWV